ncbi:hypothetical protein L7F22_027199 [Adiantum nelumboides]|nr:hypothetical protein [Adiantum nelumboides]
MEEMGTVLEALSAFKGQQVPVTPLIGKLCVHVQGYVDQEEFYISPLSADDVILGAPWFHRLAAKLEFLEQTISFKFRNKDINIHTEDTGSTIPIVSHASLQKSMKSNIFAYMIFAQESKPDSLSVDEKDQQMFLNSFKDCFADEIPKELPPSRGEDDHKIDLVPEVEILSNSQSKSIDPCFAYPNHRPPSHLHLCLNQDLPRIL